MILMAITSKGSIVDVERVREGKSVVSTEIIHWFSEDVVRVVFEGVHSRDLSFIGCREIVGEEGGGGWFNVNEQWWLGRDRVGGYSLVYKPHSITYCHRLI